MGHPSELLSRYSRRQISEMWDDFCRAPYGPRATIRQLALLTSVVAQVAGEENAPMSRFLPGKVDEPKAKAGPARGKFSSPLLGLMPQETR